MIKKGSKELAEKMADLTFSLLEQCQLKQERISKILGLTVAEFKLIRSFRNDKNLKVNDLAKRMDLSSSRLTRILDGLVAKKIINREPSENDRRTMNISLTPKGKKIQNELNETYIKTHEEIVELLPEGGGDAVIFAMEKLNSAMEKWVERLK